MANGSFLLNLRAVLDTSSINRQIQEIGRTQRINIDSRGVQQVTQETRRWQEGLNRVVTETRNIDAATGKVTSTMRTVNESAQRVSQSFTDIVSKVGKFLLATTIISGFTMAIRGAVDAVFDFDKALIEFNKVSELSGDGLEEYTDKLKEMGSEVARTRTEMLQSATIFKKTGATEADAAQLAKMGELYRNIADEQVSSADAASFIVAEMKAFNIEAKDTITILDAVNEVSNKFSVGSADIATSLPKVSATMAQAGNSMSQTIALITAGTELMPGQASRVARGLRSVTLNLQGLTDEGDENLELLPKMEDDFKKLGITLYGTDGQLKSTFDILKELAEVYPTLDANTKNYYSALIGG